MAALQPRIVLKEKSLNSRSNACANNDTMVTKSNEETTTTTSGDKAAATTTNNNNNSGSNNNKSKPAASPSPSTSHSNNREGSKRAKVTRPKPVYFWTNAEVLRWLLRQCADYHKLYKECFVEHDITGRSLVRLNEINLEALGIKDKTHRDELWQEILKLRLKTDIMEMRDLEMKSAVA